jgi:uncharacterized protein (DUF58 family)
MARVRQIQLRTNRMVSATLAGAYRSSFRGTGMEFEEARLYQPGDDARSIDWNVTARAGAPHVKTYREERQLTLQFVVDTSLSMDFGSGARTKREIAAERVAQRSFVAIGQQDMVGLSLFDEETGLHLPARKGSQHVLRVVREVIAAPALGPRSDLAAALEHEAETLPRSSLVFVVSDFRTDSDYEMQLRSLAARHDVIAVRVVDPLEEELPSAGILPLLDVESGRTIEVDTRSRRVRRWWSEDARKRREELATLLRRARTDRMQISTDGDVADPVVALFRRRALRGRRR